MAIGVEQTTDTQPVTGAMAEGRDRFLPPPDPFLLELFLSQEQGSCPKNAVYERLMQLMIRNIYDPSVLGDTEVLLNKHNCDIKNNDDAITFAEKAVESIGDPHTQILNPKEVEALTKRVEASFAGIGIAIKSVPDQETQKGPLTVRRVFEGGPAEKAGLKAGDVIVKIDDFQIAQDTDQAQSIEKIRGRTGTDVTLTVLRPVPGKEDQELTIKITRDQVNAPAVDERRLEGNIAYIQLSDFIQRDAADEMKAALIKHQDADAYIIDLRYNTGGQVLNALKISSMFMSDGTLITVKARQDSDPKNPQYVSSRVSLNSGEERGRIESTSTTDQLPQVSFFDKEKDIIDKPVVILTNEYSASASEMLAGALRDNGVATIIGTKTFGKGVAQIIIPSGSAAVQVTHSRYYTPSGEWVGDGHNNRTGLKPDIEVANPKGTELGSADDVQLRRAIEFLQTKTKPS